MVCLSLVGMGAYGAQTQVALVLSAEVARPGDTVMAGISMDIPEGWHTYWQNPGGPGQITSRLKQKLVDIQHGKAPDPHKWVYRIG